MRVYVHGMPDIMEQNTLLEVIKIHFIFGLSFMRTHVHTFEKLVAFAAVATDEIRVRLRMMAWSPANTHNLIKSPRH